MPVGPNCKTNEEIAREQPGDSPLYHTAGLWGGEVERTENGFPDWQGLAPSRIEESRINFGEPNFHWYCPSGWVLQDGLPVPARNCGQGLWDRPRAANGQAQAAIPHIVFDACLHFSVPNFNRFYC
jgi:hypothetical protein